MVSVAPSDVFKRDWSTCSKYDSHSRPNSQHNWGDLYDHLMSIRTFTLLISTLKTYMISKNYDYSFGWIAKHLVLITCVILTIGMMEKFKDRSTLGKY